MKNYLLWLCLVVMCIQATAQERIHSLNGKHIWTLSKDERGIIYAGGFKGAQHAKVFRTTDNGKTWDTLYHAGKHTIWSIASDGKGLIVAANHLGGLILSTDDGKTFQVKDTSAFNGSKPWGVAIGKNGYIYVSSSDGVFRSTDTGANFELVGLQGLNVYALLTDKDSANYLYAGVSAKSGKGIGFYKSTDGGRSFSKNLNPNKNGYALFQDEQGNLYMLSTQKPYHLDKSTNRGENWQTITMLPDVARSIAINKNFDMFIAGNSGVFYSKDGGKNFIQQFFTRSATPILCHDEWVFVGADDGVWIYSEQITQNK
jgi:photosystem II stability/assembly factor-like uncharacterized protein